MMLPTTTSSRAATTFTSRDPILSVQGLVKRFGGVVALDGVDLDLPRGRITGLFGPNGSGKTTLFDAISGYTRPDRGTVTFNGRRVNCMPAHRLAQVPPGLTRSFQEVRLFDQLSLLENLLVARPFTCGTTVFGVLRRLCIARELRAQQEAAIRLLELLGLADLRHREAHRLSYGQRKLLEIGRCFASDSGMVLLDEPFAGVNSVLIDAITAMLRRAMSEGVLRRTILVVDHNRSALAELCDRVYSMERGRIVGRDASAEMSAQDGR